MANIDFKEKDGAVDIQGNVTLNGEALATNGTPAVVFAESERQKSKNLFKVNDSVGTSETRNGVTATINEDFTITLNGTCTAKTWWGLFNGIKSGSTFSGDYPKLYLDETKTYTFMLKYISGSYDDAASTDEDEIIVGASYRQTDGSELVFEEYVMLTTKSEDISKTTASHDYINNGYFRTTPNVVYTDYTFGLMICEGEDDDFLPYNGAIVHEAELKKDYWSGRGSTSSQFVITPDLGTNFNVLPYLTFSEVSSKNISIEDDVFIIRKSGKYYIDFNCEAIRKSDSTSMSNMYIRIYKSDNSPLLQRAYNNANPSSEVKIPLNVSGIVELNEGDTLKLMCQRDNTAVNGYWNRYNFTIMEI